MEYFMVPAQKVPSLQHFRKTEKDVIGGLCRYVQVTRASRNTLYSLVIIAGSHLFWGSHALHRRRRGNMLHPAALLLCTRPTRGALWELISVKCWIYTPIRSSGSFHSHPGSRPGVLFGIFECEIDVFCGEQTQTTWLRGHHAATPLPRRIPSALFILVLPLFSSVTHRLQ